MLDIQTGASLAGGYGADRKPKSAAGKLCSGLADGSCATLLHALEFKCDPPITPTTCYFMGV